MTTLDETRTAAPQLHFAAGIPAFPDARRFELRSWGDPDGPFSVMQSLDDADLAFVVTHPGWFFPDFQIDIDDDTADRLGLREPTDALVLVIVTVRERAQDATANLLGPIVVNRHTNEAMQVVLHNSSYDVRTPLASN
ncbi:MAG TPA: flagellar assembly protein FliW [Acidimicrobiia bacterium]|nr:flagellar assembly protein FliW [Acidimicrobiia bacterium]